jgi:5'-deoxynucleotidase YfbR-like HD superfamily hydrolase
MKQHSRIKALREGGWTDRLHAIIKNRRYSVAEHSWNVANLAAALFEKELTTNLLLACLWHDIPERWCGDIPSPAKYWLNPTLGQEAKKSEKMVAGVLNIAEPFVLQGRAKAILAYCDLLELVLWCKEELDLGNSHVGATFDHALAELRSGS